MPRKSSKHSGEAFSMVTSCAVISSCKVNEVCGRCFAAGAYTCAAHLGKIVFKHDEDFPLVSVRVGNPGFILDGVTAGGLHLVAGVESRHSPLLAHGENIGGWGSLKSQGAKGAT